MISVTVADISTGLKTITSTGCIPNCSLTSTKRKITVQASAIIKISFPYTVQAGSGGITFTDNDDPATISGKAYSNAGITCAGPTSNCVINGDAWMNATPGPIPVTPTTGFQRNVGAPQIALPTFDETVVRQAASCNNNANCIQDCPGSPPTCTLSGGTFVLKPGQNVGPYKCCQFNGNLTLDNLIVSVQGPVYTKSVAGANPANGYIAISGESTSIAADPTLGSCGTVILSDGQILIWPGVRVLDTSASPPGYLLFETTATNNQAIYIYQWFTNIRAIFYAKNGGLTLTATSFNSPALGAFTGNAVSLDRSNTAYGPGLPDAKFCGLNNTWTIVKGTYKITK